MNLSALFIDRPVATTLLGVAIFLSGVLAWFNLPVAPLPNITFPVVVVQATMAGASPEIMAATVAEPLERRLATISGVTQLTSGSQLGSTGVVLQFELSRSIDAAGNIAMEFNSEGMFRASRRENEQPIVAIYR